MAKETVYEVRSRIVPADMGLPRPHPLPVYLDIMLHRGNDYSEAQGFIDRCKNNQPDRHASKVAPHVRSMLEAVTAMHPDTPLVQEFYLIAP